MAKRIFALVNRIRELASQQGGYSTTNEIVGALALGSQQAWNALLPAKSQRAVGPGLNRSLDNRLHPFLRTKSLTAADMSNGSFTLPLGAYVSFYDAEGADAVEEVVGMAWKQRLADPNCGPTSRAPVVRGVAHPTEQGHQIVPTPDSLEVNYYAVPTEPVYAEVYPNGFAEYDDANSVDTSWGPEMDPELIVRALRILGLEIRDPQLQAVATQLTAESQ